MRQKIESQLAGPSKRVKSALVPRRALMLKTTRLLLFIVFVIVVWDVVLARWDPTRANTWSEVARAVSYGLPILPWFLGVLVGHLFHGGRMAVMDRDAGATLMALFTILVMAWSVFLYLTDGALPIVGVAGMAIVGTAAAYLIWPLTRPEEWQW
jgi:hypothetical protein